MKTLETIAAQGEEIAIKQAEKLAKTKAELRGKDLACWCPLDRPCHADVLLELANEDSA